MREQYKTIFCIILFLVAIKTKGQGVRIDTIKHYVSGNNTVYYFPKIVLGNKKIENKANEIINKIVVENLAYDSLKTKIHKLTATDLDTWYNSNFLVLYNGGSIVSIEFYLDGKGQPLPFTFIKTIDLIKLKVLEFDDLLDIHHKDELYSIINKQINEEIDSSIEFLHEDPEVINSIDYYTECYEGVRNQKTFNFYIEELNKAIILRPGCCRSGADGFCSLSYGFNFIYKYLKKDYQSRIK